MLARERNRWQDEWISNEQILMRTGNYQSSFLDSLLLSLDISAKLHAYNIYYTVIPAELRSRNKLNRGESVTMLPTCLRGVAWAAILGHETWL